MVPNRSPGRAAGWRRAWTWRVCLWVGWCVFGGPGWVQAEPGQPAKDSGHWAFRRPVAATPPTVRDAAWPQTAIDRFILGRLESAGLRPSPPTDARTLIRRMSFDLLGLPPGPEEVEQFVADVGRNRAAAVNALVDRLLASPRYGERWGRHWLDVARYSDTKGYVYAREERRFVHAPAYRDWVIRAFNQDLPYDRFLLLQLAADQLVPAGSPDLAAMGFLTGGRRFLGVTHDIIDDRIDVVTRGTMALTVSCARCHDHKYDPIPTADYYSLYGVIRGNDEKLVTLAESEDAELAKRRKKLEEQVALRRGEANRRLRERVAEYLAAQLELRNYPEEGFEQILGPGDIIPLSVRRWRDYLQQLGPTPHPIFHLWQELIVGLKDVAEADWPAAAARKLREVTAHPALNPRVAAAFATPPASRREVAERYGQVFAAVEAGGKAPAQAAGGAVVETSSPPADAAAGELRRFLHDGRSPTVVPDTPLVNTEYFYPTPVTQELMGLQREVDGRLIELGVPAALVLVDRAPEPNPVVFRRGSPSQPGPEVPRRFLRVVAGPDQPVFRHGNGRLEMAQAIATPENPLTARVMVNRVWQHHFGVGLVKTPSDFGRRAEPPSHPELLDWLACRWTESGWSLKTLHRWILTSAVYQTATAGGADERGAARAIDPDNRLLAHFPLRRLDFEQMRDAMLAVSGQLELPAGGMPGDLLAAGNRRRTVYGLVDRQYLPGVLRTFDFANPDLHVAVRHETTVPQQGLYFLNGPFAADRARALAGRWTDRSGEERIRAMHRLLFQREPTDAEVRAGLAFVEAAAAEHPTPPAEPAPSPWSYGVGSYDESSGRVKSFRALGHFTGSAWQETAAWPGGESGWAQLTAEGGHPGNTREFASIRRWTAPRSMSVRVTGLLVHEPEPGDGVRALVVSSRKGLLKQAAAHHGRVELAVEEVRVETGDTLDFVVDVGGGLGYDQFLWAPVVEGGGGRWDARLQFNGRRPAPPWLSPWEQYAQVLLLTNEFAFAD